MRRDIPVNCCDTRYRDGTRFNSAVNSARNCPCVTLLRTRACVRRNAFRKIVRDSRETSQIDASPLRRKKSDLRFSFPRISGNDVVLDRAFCARGASNPRRREIPSRVRHVEEPRKERVAVSRMECDGKFDDAFKTGPRIERASFPARRPRKRVTRALGGSARARSAGYQIESSRLSYFPREFSAWRPPAESSEISKRRSRSSSAISSGKFDTLARSSELAVDD